MLFLLSGPSTAELNRATLIVFFAITQITATIAFAIEGLVDAQVLWTTLLLSPLFWTGTHAGAWLFEPRRETTYRRVALALLGAAGLVALL